MKIFDKFIFCFNKVSKISSLLSASKGLLSNFQNDNRIFTFYVNTSDIFELKNIVCQENFQSLIFDSLPPESESKLVFITSFFQIPLFWISSTWPWKYTAKNDNSIIFQHNLLDLAEIVVKYIREYTISETLLVGDEFSRNLFLLVFNLISQTRVELITGKELTGENCSSRMRSVLIRMKWKLQIIVLAEPGSVPFLLRKAESCGYIQPDITWIIVNSCLPPFSLSLPLYSSINFVSFFDSRFSNQIYPDCFIKKGEVVIKYIIDNLHSLTNSTDLFNLIQPHKCNIERPITNKSFFTEIFSEFKKSFLAGQNGYLNIEKTQLIDPNNASVSTSELYRGFKFENISLSVCVRQAPTLYHNSTTGFIPRILTKLYEKFNFNWSIVTPETGNMENCNEKLVKKLVDVSVDFASILDTSDLPIVFWTILEEEHCFILGVDPVDYGVTLWAPVQFFNWTFLLLLGGCLVIYSLLALIFTKFNPPIVDSNSTMPALTADSSFLDFCWNLTGAFLAQGLEYNPLNPSLSTLSFFWWVYSIIISSVYSGSLTVTMTVTNNRYSFLSNSIFELLKTERVDVFIVRGSYIDKWLNNSTENVYSLLKSRKIYVSTLEECIQNVLNHISSKSPQLAVCLAPCINTMTPREICDKMRMLSDTLFPISISLGFHEMSPWKNFIISELNTMKFMGVMEQFRHDSISNINCLPQNQNDQFSGQSISISGLIGVIYLIYALIFMGIICLGLEIVYKNLKKKELIKRSIFSKHFQ